MTEQDTEEMLLEMKEKAEFMVDLAYSSIIYDNTDLAEEVYELEEFMDDLNERFQKLAIRAVQNDELDVDEAMAMIQLAICSEMIADGARAISDIQLRDVELHPIIKESILESDEVFVRERIGFSSVLNDATLGELELASKTGMWIIAIKREGHWIYNVDKKSKLLEADIVLARGVREGMDHFARLASGDDQEI